MNFNTQLYLILSTLYFLSVSLLSLPAILKPKKQESSVESYSSPKNTCSTQPSSSRFNYKRADLTIIIPEDDLINVSTQGELILLFFKQNCFPFSLFKSKSVGLKFQKCTKLFLVISFNLCTSILLLKYSTLASSKPDLFIVGPLICCVGGLVFAAIVAAINGVKIEGNLGKLVKIIQVVLFFTSWVLGLSVNIWVKGVPKNDYLIFVVIVLMMEIFLFEFVRTSFKFTFYAWFKADNSISEYLERI